jgi:hypothetical protein
LIPCRWMSEMEPLQVAQRNSGGVSLLNNTPSVGV